MAASDLFPLRQFLASVPLSSQEKRAYGAYLRYCYGFGKMIGNQYVPLLCDALGVPDSQVTGVARFTGYLRAYTVVDDDLLDLPAGPWRKTLRPLRAFFVSKARSEAMALGSEARDILSSALTSYGGAAREYRNYERGVVQKPSRLEYVNGFPRRMAVVKAPLFILALKSPDERATAAVSAALDSLMVASKILDDLVDWEEDLRCGRVNHVVSTFVADYGADDDLASLRGSRLLKQLQSVLPFHESVRFQLECSVGHLDAAIESLESARGKRFRRVLESLRSQLHHIAQQVEPANNRNLIRYLAGSGVAPCRQPDERCSNWT